MHAVLVSVSVDADVMESAQATLREQVVPTVAREPGFVAGYWLEPEHDGKGISIVVFEAEEQARQAAPSVGPAPVPGVTIDSVDFRAVMANA